VLPTGAQAGRLVYVPPGTICSPGGLEQDVLTCVPEPPADSKPQAIALARDRYHRLIKAAGLRKVWAATLRKAGVPYLPLTSFGIPSLPG